MSPSSKHHLGGTVPRKRFPKASAKSRREGVLYEAQKERSSSAVKGVGSRKAAKRGPLGSIKRCMCGGGKEKRRPFGGIFSSRR